MTNETTATECSRKGKWFGGCNFQARFDAAFPERGFKIDTFNGVVDDLKDKKYVRDICTTCGKAIER